MALGHAVVFYDQAAHTISAGIIVGVHIKLIDNPTLSIDPGINIPNLVTTIPTELLVISRRELGN